MKKVIYKILFVSLFALLINCIFIQENYAAIDYGKECKKAEEELKTGELKLIIQQGKIKKELITKTTDRGHNNTFETVWDNTTDTFQRLYLKHTESGVKKENTYLFFYLEQNFLKSADINAKLDSCTCKKTQEEIGVEGNDSYSGIFEISGFDVYGEKKDIKFTINNKNRYNIIINIRLNIKPLYKSHKEKLEGERTCCLGNTCNRGRWKQRYYCKRCE